MTQNRKKDIEKMISNIYPTFDGIVGVVNQPSNDGTFELLEANKKDGKIIKADWTPNHGFLMNYLFFYGGIRDNSWCLYLDSPEYPTEKFIFELPKIINQLENHGHDSLYWDNRPYLFKYNQYLQFFGAVHWGIDGLKKPITIPNKEEYIINTRLNNKEISWCLNGSKYYICYPLGNEVYSTYHKYHISIVNEMEGERRNIRAYLKNVLNLNLDTLDDLIGYMKKIESKEIIPSDFFINAVENQFRLSELYQLKVLNMDFMNEIAKKRHKWSFKAHLLNGNGWIEGYIGKINQLNKQFNLPLE